MFVDKELAGDTLTITVEKLNGDGENALLDAVLSIVLEENLELIRKVKVLIKPKQISDKTISELQKALESFGFKVEIKRV